MAYQNTGTIGPEDGDALIALKEDHAPTEQITSSSCARSCRRAFPGTTFSFLPADIVSQILNFGLPAPIDMQVAGNNQAANYAYATDLLKRIRKVPGIADLRIQQVFNYPQINVEVDRTLAGVVGLDPARRRQQPTGDLVRQRQVTPNFWLNPQNGVSYPIVAQMPQYRIDTMSDLANVPVHRPRTKTPQYLGGLGANRTGAEPRALFRITTCSRSSTFTARSKAAISARWQPTSTKSCKRRAKDVPRGSYVVLRGQVADHDQRL